VPKWTRIPAAGFQADEPTSRLLQICAAAAIFLSLTAECGFCFPAAEEMNVDAPHTQKQKT